jgi:hypothetical protein
VVSTIEEMLAEYRRPERTVVVTLDGPAMACLEELRRELAVAQLMDLQAEPGDEPLAPAIAEQIEETEAAAVASARRFHLRGLGARAYRDLIDAHPKDGWRWDPVTFPPALLAATCIDPVVTAAQANLMFTDWTIEAVGTIFAAAVEVCEGPQGADRAATEYALLRLLEQQQTAPA